MTIHIWFIDFTFHPRRKADSPFILELKKDDVDSAIKQMKEKEYFQKFIKEHKNVLLVVICYDSKMKNHSCKIESVYYSGFQRSHFASTMKPTKI